MEGFPIIDFHSHVLPHIDDGSADVSESLSMLREMKRQGVDVCVATPHCYAFRRKVEEFLALREKSKQSLREQMDDTVPVVLTGAEVAFYSGILNEPALRELCIEGTDILMIEMPFDQWTSYETDILSTLCLDRGYEIILAHLERFIPFQRNKDALNTILQLPLYPQMNAECLLHLTSRSKALSLVRDGSVRLLGSDCHNMAGRRPNLAAGREVIRKKLGEDFLEETDRLGQLILSAALSGEEKINA